MQADWAEQTDTVAAAAQGITEDAMRDQVGDLSECISDKFKAANQVERDQ